MLGTDEIKTEARGRRLHELKLLSCMSKSEGEVMKTSGNVGRGTNGCAQDYEAVEQKTTFAEGIRSLSQVSLNGWRNAVKDGGASGRMKYVAFGIKDESQ
jgi:hypothetical protein